MGDLFALEFKPIAQVGQLVAVQRASELFPRSWYRVAQMFALPTISLTISANATDERQQALEVPPGWLAQYRYIVTTAGSQVVLRRPRATVGYTTRTGQFYVDATTDENWGSADRLPPATEFFVLGGDEVSFNEQGGVAATVRFSGYKFLLEPVEDWLLEDVDGAVKRVALSRIDPQRLHRLQNFAGVVMADQQ